MTSTNLASEDLFLELFAETFGLDKVKYLVPEHAFEDIYGQPRRIDYALTTGIEKYALELDGQRVRDPAFVRQDKYIDDLLRQNSLVYQGWKVYRWAYRQLKHNREQVKSELVQFLGEDPLFRLWEEFLPVQRAGTVAAGGLELREHQTNALQELERLRAEGKTIALLTHATGTGKTTTAVLNARRMQLPTLFVAHTRELLIQASRTFARLWPEAQTVIEDGEGSRLIHSGSSQHPQVVVSSVQYLTRRLAEYEAARFGYIVIDEAHHATARTYQDIIGYFRPRFLLGLTATPERMDGKSLLEIFQHVAHRMDLRQAVELGELVPIRCIRVKTNVDLSSVRFNGVRYVAKDLDEKLHIPERNHLIVQTYIAHVPGERTVVFCANVDHAETVAQLFRTHGVNAAAVSGRLGVRERQRILDEYEHGQIKVLCACDILNEGWDSPATKVLFMTRPTLSKVIYLQQLGRGTRKAPGKDALLVFDFIDNASRYNQGLSLHRLFKIQQYAAGKLVLAPPEKIAEENAVWNAAELAKERPEVLVNLNLWIRDVEPVDLFDWQDAVEHMWSHRRVAYELGVPADTVLNGIKRGKVAPDHVLPIGRQTYYYFEPDQTEKVRQQLGLPKRRPEAIREEFFDFVRKADMVYSYKPVTLLAMLELAGETGRVKVDDLVERFVRFYQERAEQGLPVEKPAAKMARIQELAFAEVRDVLFAMPFEKFESRWYFKRSRELTEVEWNRSLWLKLSRQDKEELAREARNQIEEYYAKHVDR